MSDRWKLHQPSRGLDPYSEDFDRRLASMSYLLDNYGSNLHMTKSGDVLPAIPAVDEQDRPVYALQAVACPIHAPEPPPNALGIPKQHFARPCLGCGHVLTYPIEEIKTITRTPQGLFLCKVCWGGFERKRLKVDEVCGIGCLHCVEDKIKTLQQIDPLRYTDLLVRR